MSKSKRTLAELLAPLSGEEHKAKPMEMWIRIGEMAARLRTIDALHRPDKPAEANSACIGCGEWWPCMTNLALDGEQ